MWDYFNHRRFRELPTKTAGDYRNKLRAMANFRLLNGDRFGALPWVEIEANHTDKLYELMCYANDGGLRESYARAVMHTARIVWNWAERYHRREFQWNPFKGMKLPSADARTIKWEPEQVWMFCKTAEEMSRLSVALVAVFCYELGQRVGDARRMCRSMFEDDGIICVEQGKTGKRLVLPVSDVLQSYVVKVPSGREELVINENTGRPYTDYEFSHAAAEVREKAGLPSHLWVADLRRTCINELAVLGASDDQLISVSGHTKRQTLSVYSLTEYRKALDIMQRRWADRNGTNAA
ncbi:MAG TPA: tyrosine-type recombinase/integrase [Candidatus Binataceae bacterium]|nr:tyrosine-type recombinase/integrase [Candidatus Binataceae bacterium]